MADKPDTHTKGDQPEKGESISPSAVAGATFSNTAESATESQAQKSSEKRKYTEYVVRAIIAPWHGVSWTWRGIIWIIGRLFGFLDQHHSSITAFATVMIGYLTWQYVKYSRGQ